MPPCKRAAGSMEKRGGHSQSPPHSWGVKALPTRGESKPSPTRGGWVGGGELGKATVARRIRQTQGE